MSKWKKNKETPQRNNANLTEVIEKNEIIKLLFAPINKLKITDEQYTKVCLEYPNLKLIIDLVNDFRNIFKMKDINRIDDWVEKAKAHNIRQLNSFIKGIERDIIAVKNAIEYEYSNGLAEGCVNKIKLVKRIMFGRCNFHTLKNKVLMLEYYRKFN